MPTLEQQRRAIGTANERSRRAIGRNNEAARRALDSQMVERRTGAATVADINSVVRPQVQRRTLSTIEPRGGLPTQKGRGTYVPPKTPAGGTGIASPLTETDYAEREYWAEQTITSADGLLSFRMKPIKRLLQTDANSAEVEQLFAEPTVPTP